MTVALVTLGISLLGALMLLSAREHQHSTQDIERLKAWNLREGALLQERIELTQRFRSEQAEMEDRHQSVEQLGRQALADLNEQFAKERSELLTRIQHPEVILPSIPISEEGVAPREEDDEIDLIGAVMDGAEDG